MNIEDLRSRQSTYLPTHYLSTHITAVGVALGVAGVTAASLIAPGSDTTYRPVFWVLFGAAVLAIAAAYAGTMIGAILLPATLPGVTDLLMPLALTLSEFLLFGTLAFQITGVDQPTAIVAWWFAFAAFGLATFGSVLRARCLLRDREFAGAALGVMRRYRRTLRVDLIATATMCLFGLAFGTVQWRLHTPAVGNLYGHSAATVNLIAGLCVGAVLLAALVGHSRTARQLRADIANPPTYGS